MTVAFLSLLLVKTEKINEQMIVLPKLDKIGKEGSYIEVYSGKANEENQSHYLFATTINGLYLSFDTQL